MSCLTEVALIYDSNNYKKNNNIYYNRFYLCVENSIQSYVINGFDCYRFNTLEQAERNREGVYNRSYVKKYPRTTVICINKWIPRIFDKFILNYKLQNFFWLGKHTIYENKDNKI